MPIRQAIWKIGDSPEPLSDSVLANEQLLEDMIVAAPRILSDEGMLIGRPEDTGVGGRIDLLALAPVRALVLIDVHRCRTCRPHGAPAPSGWCAVISSSPIGIC